MKYLLRSYDFQQPEIANAFDDTSLWSAPFGLLMLREMPLIQTGRVLDIGCGTGFPLLPLAQRLGPDVQLTGIDPWLAAIERAHAKAVAFKIANVDLLHGSATEMPFDEEEFDLVVSNLGINNFQDVDQAFAEAYRVLKGKGRLCLTTNPVGTFARYYEVMLETLAEKGEAEALHGLSQQMAARRTPHQIEELFQNAGFEVTRSVEDMHVMRYANGSAFLHDYLVILGFLPAWKELLVHAKREPIFKIIEKKLNAIAREEGEFCMEVPMLYMEGMKADEF